MSLKINKIEQKYYTFDITYCCNEMKFIHENTRFILLLDENNKLKPQIKNDYTSIGINFCPFCGEKLNED
jgi:hypothetical protein